MAVTIAVPAAARALLPDASWTIRKDHWDAADEADFGRFVASIGESTCATPQACFQGSANPFRSTDPVELLMDGDCADFVYQLRGYYAWKKALPFSMALYVVPRTGDLRDDGRWNQSGNMVVARYERRWQIETNPIDILNRLGGIVSTAMFRVESAYDKGFSTSDFYSPRIIPGSIRPGTVIYDINGHVVIVYKVSPNGEVHYVDSNPDRTVTRGVYGGHFPRSDVKLGAGFVNFRPLRLVDYAVGPNGVLVGGRFALATNAEIPDFSLEQFYGTGTATNWREAAFSIDGESMRFPEFVRRRLMSAQPSQ
ncbi:MAG: hypothetical protein GC199_04600 [Alphaproteobacteria bacterium]|nr:hypothetical protein [Alphaproteobacteria bacterium]